MTEPFDAVLEKARNTVNFCPSAERTTLHTLLDRLAAAHNEELRSAAAEVAEWKEKAEWQGAITKELLTYQERAEAAERNAGELRGLLREARDYVQIAANEEAAMNECKVEAAHRTSEARFLASIDRVIATTEQADD